MGAEMELWLILLSVRGEKKQIRDRRNDKKDMRISS